MLRLGVKDTWQRKMGSLNANVYTMFTNFGHAVYTMFTLMFTLGNLMIIKNKTSKLWQH